MKKWCELSQSQQNFYIEFYASKLRDKYIIPSNNTMIHYDSYTPNEIHVCLVTYRGSMLQSLNVAITQGQRNAIIDWLEENNPHQENTIYN